MARLFIALEVQAPWPMEFPQGRLLREKERHATLAFLGESDPKKVIEDLNAIDLSPLTIGPAGIFDKCLFLPKRYSRTVSWHVHFLTEKEPLYNVQKALISHFVPNETRDFLPHVTVARKPFNEKAWQEAFTPLPLYGSHIHLYESVGNLTYVPLYTKSLIPPFEEKEHTADIAFTVRARNMHELYLHAAIALSFTFTPFVGYIDIESKEETLEEVVSRLNTMIAHADSNEGCPVKAVSYHGELKQDKNLLEWEMIVDV